MMMLQPQVNLLDRFVIQQESIPNLIPAMSTRQMQFNNRGPNGMNSLVKNVFQIRYAHKTKLCLIQFYIFHLQTQNMSISKSSTLEPQTKFEQGRSANVAAVGNHQKLNKSMSESHIDTSRIRLKYPRPSDLEHSTIRHRPEHSEQEPNASNGCILM